MHVQLIAVNFDKKTLERRSFRAGSCHSMALIAIVLAYRKISK